MTTVTERVASFTANLNYADLPPDVREKAKVALTHNLGVALAAGSMADGAFAYAKALEQYGGSGSRLFITGRPATPFTAAYVNAALIHARAQDDVYFPGLTHVGATVIPAILAVGEAHRSSGEELLTALVAGYEAAAALSQDVAQRTTARGFRATGIYGVFGATAAVARLLNLDEETTVHALGIAACLASGTNQTWVAGTQEWQFQAGVVARNGISAAIQAAAGGTGAPDALEGTAGFYNAFLGDCEGVGEIGKDLGTKWRVRDVTYKPYPVCAILQAPVTELISMMRENNLTAEQIVTLSLALSPPEASYPGTDSVGPFVGVGATLMSAQFCLAVAAEQGGVTAADLTRHDDPELGSLIDRVHLQSDPDLAPRSFVLAINRADGTTCDRHFTSTVDTFNWDREQLMTQLQRIKHELPVGIDGIEALAAITLNAEEHTVRDVVSACVPAG